MVQGAQGCSFKQRRRRRHAILNVKDGTKQLRLWPTTAAESRRPGGLAPSSSPSVLGGRAPATSSSSATVVRIGSDCTGLNTISLALELCGFQVADEFASEKDTKTRLMLMHNFKIGKLFPDIFERDDSHLPPLDLYTAGPPCQSFSADGLNQGILDPRGVVLLRVLQTVASLRPRTFIIENVLGLKQRHHQVYRLVLKFLQRMTDDDGTKTYKIRAHTLDSKEVGGVPQSRSRVYIVGWKRSEERHAFEWPSPIPAQSLVDILDTTLRNDPTSLVLPPSLATNVATALKHANRITNGGNVFDTSESPVMVANVDSSAARGGGLVVTGHVPCLTKSRCGGGGHWVVNLHRKLTQVEMERLQGVPPGRFSRPHAVTERQYAGMLGNAFTVGVVGRVALRLLKAVGIVDASCSDPWHLGSPRREPTWRPNPVGETTRPQ